MNVHWTETAIAHLLAIYERIAHNTPLYAQRMIDRLTKRSEQIATFPESGRMVPEYEAPDIREVICSRTNFEHGGTWGNGASHS